MLKSKIYNYIEIKKKIKIKTATTKEKFSYCIFHTLLFFKKKEMNDHQSVTERQMFFEIWL